MKYMKSKIRESLDVYTSSTVIFSSPTMTLNQIDDDDDIYIMMKCLSVCLCVTKNDHFFSARAELGLAGSRPALA